MRFKNKEFSKKIMICSGAVVVVITAFTMYMIWKTENLDPLIYLIPASFGAYGTAAGFYFSKAKKENEIKLRKKYGAEIYNDAKGEDFHA
jgi:hypothetical protein